MRLRSKHLYSELIIFLTFFLLIGSGALILQLPFIQHSNTISVLDAIFTATSAVCVTGLFTLPTSGFNQPGQLVILALVQLGGIGIMTLTTGLILFLRGELDLRQRMMAARLNESYALKDVEQVLWGVLGFTLVAESLGSVILWVAFQLEGFSLRESLYHGIFHAVSAFCNAGFSTFNQSLIHTGIVTKITIMALIVMGGLGYYVIFDLSQYLQKRDRISIHTRVVLMSSGGLIIIGAAGIFLLEPGQVPLIDAFFQAITARTAGFNTMDIGALQSTSMLLLVILMIIGAAPGSTGGGVKITTVVVILLTICQVLMGRKKIILFGRSLPLENILRSFTLVGLYLILLTMGTGLLLYFESGDFFSHLFEMTSALGTVGLSKGLPLSCGPSAKIILIMGMFVGRVGPAILILGLLRRQQHDLLEYPEEKIILG